MSWRQRLFGDQDRLGWWLLPMFLVVGLAGAVLAGSLAIVYYGQQVDGLRRETAAAREETTRATEEVREVADDALASIEAEAEAVRDRLAQDLPLADGAERGVVRLRVDAELPGTPVEPDGAAAEPDAAEPDAAERDAAEPAGAALEPERVRRAGTGFVVVRDADETFLATSFSLVADPRRPEVPLDVEVVVLAGAGETRARVHSWDADRDLLLLRTRLGPGEPLGWRPADRPVSAGDRVVAIGVTPALRLARVAGQLAGTEGPAWVSDVPALDLLRGGPVVDVDGRVVGIASTAFAPFGGDPAIVPIRALCDELLRACPE